MDKISRTYCTIKVQANAQKPDRQKTVGTIILK